MKRLALALSMIALATGCHTGSRPPHVGSAAAEFSLRDSDRNVTLMQFRGQVLVLNFWATWCPPCEEELPSLMRMQDGLRARGVTVLGVSIDVDGDAYHRFLKQRGVNFLTIRDPDQKIATIYGTSGWPETYIIDRQGVMRRKFVGAVDWTSPEVVDYLSKL